MFPEDPLTKLITYIEGWLKSNAENQKAIKPLTDFLEILKWAKKATEEMPVTLKSKYPTREYLKTMFDTVKLIEKYVPPTPSVNLQGIYMVASSSTSVASTAFLLLGQEKTSSPEERDWVSGTVEELAEIQERQEGIKKTGELIKKLQAKAITSPNLFEEYTLMIEKAFYGKGTEHDQSISAGNAMRNVLNHYKGKLIQIAKTHLEENNLKWKTMIERLASCGSGHSLYNLLLAEENTWSRLQSELTELTKNTKRSDIRKVAVELIVHLSFVLTFMKLE